MFSTSTQKRFWTFGSQSELDELRCSANRKYIERFGPVAKGEPGVAANDEIEFLTPEEELSFCRVVTEAGIRFSDDFKPEMWPSVRWTAFAYFKRFYLKESIMEYSPKNVMIASYYLAAKVDEFNISIDNFIDNLSNGTRESNIEMVLTLEPAIMLKLNYNLTVHAPFRPFEGHLIEMKALMANELSKLNLDLESIRPYSNEYFKDCLYGDVMLLYAPSQIALAAVKHGLDKAIGEAKSASFIRDFFSKLFQADFGGTGEKNSTEIIKLEKLQIRIGQIASLLVLGSATQEAKMEESSKLQKKYISCIQKLNEMLPRIRQIEREQQQQQQATGAAGTTIAAGAAEFDSDDDF